MGTAFLRAAENVDTLKCKIKTYLFSLDFNRVLFIYLSIYLRILARFASWCMLVKLTLYTKFEFWVSPTPDFY